MNRFNFRLWEIYSDPKKAPLPTPKLVSFSTTWKWRKYAKKNSDYMSCVAERGRECGVLNRLLDNNDLPTQPEGSLIIEP